MSVSQVVLTIIIAAATGIASALVTPWAHWGVEKHKLRRERRQEVLLRARNHMSYPGSTYCTFRQMAEYPLLRPYLSATLVEGIEKFPPHPFAADNSHHLKHQKAMLDELARVEAKWGLI